jgi:hypothetical protein
MSATGILTSLPSQALCLGDSEVSKVMGEGRGRKGNILYFCGYSKGDASEVVPPHSGLEMVAHLCGVG